MGLHRDGDDTPRALPPRGTDLDRPNPARIYDYALGGDANFTADRAAFDALSAIYPDTALVARANRAFLRRAVIFLAQEGIDQFLDIGAGLPGSWALLMMPMSCRRAVATTRNYARGGW